MTYINIQIGNLGVLELPIVGLIFMAIMLLIWLLTSFFTTHHILKKNKQKISLSKLFTSSILQSIFVWIIWLPIMFIIIALFSTPQTFPINLISWLIIVIFNFFVIYFLIPFLGFKYLLNIKKKTLLKISKEFTLYFLIIFNLILLILIILNTILGTIFGTYT